MKILITPLAIAIAVATCLPCMAQASGEPERIATRVAPLIDDQAILAVHADFDRFNSKAIMAALSSLLDKHAASAGAAMEEPFRLIDGLKAAGAREMFYVLSVADLPDYPGRLIVPLPESGPSQAVVSALKATPINEKYQVATIRRMAVSAEPGTLQQLKTLAADARPHLADAFAATGDAPLKIVFTPPGYFRKVIEEIMPDLPPVVGGGPSTVLTKGVQWAAVGITLAPQPSIRVVVKSESPDAAAALAKKVSESTGLLRLNDELRKDVPKIDEILPLLKPAVENDCVTLTLSMENGRLPKLLDLALPK